MSEFTGNVGAEKIARALNNVAEALRELGSRPHVTVNISAVGDPDAIADAVKDALAKVGRGSETRY